MAHERRLILVKQKHWIMPADEQTYAELRSLGISHTRLHMDVFDTLLDLKIKPAGIPGTVKSFDSIWTPFLEKVAAAWKRIPSTKFQNSPTSIRMDSTHPGVFHEVAKNIEKIEECFDRFFTRWGTTYEFTHSESNGRHRINVEFRHGMKPPVIAISPEAAQGTEPVTMDFGMTRILITDDDSGMPGAASTKKMELQVKCGTEYRTIHRCRFLAGAFGLSQAALNFLITNGISHEEDPEEHDPELFQKALDATAHLATAQGARKLSNPKLPNQKDSEE